MKPPPMPGQPHPVVVNLGDPEPDIETLAANIKAISASMQKLLKSGLNRKAIEILLVHETRLGRGTIQSVLNSLDDLAKKYTK